MRKIDGFSKKMAEDWTCVKVDRFSACEKDSSSQGPDKIKFLQGEEDKSRVKVDRIIACEEDSSSQGVYQIKVPSSRDKDGSSQWPDNIKISQVDKDQTCGKMDWVCTKVSAREVVDERPIGEDPHVQEQQSNSGEADTCSQHEEKVPA